MRFRLLFRNLRKDKLKTAKKETFQLTKYNPLVKQFIILTFILLITACSSSDDAQKKFEQEAFRLPNAITETNSSGDIISTDPDDWRISPFYSSFVEIRPAFPNPSGGEVLSIELLITGLGSVNGLEVFFIDEKDRLRLLFFDERTPLPTGFTLIQINPLDFSSNNTIAGAVGLHRILIYDRRGNIISYGDIKIE